MQLLPADYRRPKLIMEKVIIPEDSSPWRLLLNVYCPALIILINAIIDDKVFSKV